MRVLFLALPVDERARAACVCRSWRAFLTDTSLWQVLDLTPAGGVAAERLTGDLVQGAVARAAGSLRVFRLNDVPMRNGEALASVVDTFEFHGAALEEVSTDVSLDDNELPAIFAAAPRLQVLNADIECPCEVLVPMLRNEAPYGALRVRKLVVWYRSLEAAPVLALAAAVASHESLTRLEVERVDFAPGLNALVDAAAERRVSSLFIHDICRCDAETVRAITRLLQRGSLTTLRLDCAGFPRAPEASVVELCAALRACHTLTHLRLLIDPLVGADRHTLTELMDAAAALPVLSDLNLLGSEMQDVVAFGHAVGALLAANPPSLHTLSVSFCHLGDEGLGPLLDGLAANTHLRRLDCDANDPSDAFERNRLRPAMAALAARADLDE